ncbi:hypothetical protein PVL29_021685 [Vitis rotundifolia]|uniref:Fungal lipase-type domain-containing protein n=1 Tax=Vitis rotundifolia TaxID=103349 RepID=A0AA38Z076_VITRO|nr:hypothetical protein PVL29_021685 [Vitis rotundifolia]
MAVQRENLECTGQKQHTDVDWTNDHDRRVVAASLVQNVYNLEFDRQQPQFAQDRLRHFFNFELKRKLIDDEDSSIYGAIYEIKPTYPNHLPKYAPKYVIAFRGTILKSKRDMELDMKVFNDELHEDKPRFKHALEAVKQVVQEAWPANIWLAGHSLGSAIAMLVGKSMAQEGKDLKAFLFNPTFVRYSPSKNIKNPGLKDGISFTKNDIKAGIYFAGGDQQQELYNQFKALSSWIPNLFVNQDDPICSGYIDHFRNRKIEAELSSISALQAALGKDPHLPIYLLPKAYLTISKNSSSRIYGIREAHELKQWFATSSKVLINDPIRVGEP